MIKANRDEFLEQGFVILRNVIPPSQIENLRQSYETLVGKQRVVWARERQLDDPPGGQWEMRPQPRLHIHRMGNQCDEETNTAFELWLHENVQGVSSYLLAEEDVPVADMMLMCNPVRDRGPAAWHRDFAASRTAPLQAYTDDILENGPRYVQWNISLYDDDVLWVIPGSHVRRATEEENESMRQNPRAPVPGGVQTHLQAGDGVAYIMPILHWGSNYSTKLRRTIHGGFARLTHYADKTWFKYLSPKSQETFARWDQRSKKYVDDTEAALRAVLAKDTEKYYAALNNLHPDRGSKGTLNLTIFCSKTAKHIYNQLCRKYDSLSEVEQGGISMIHPTTLQWGLKLGNRFTAEEAGMLWERFKPVDSILQTEEKYVQTEFHGRETNYLLEQVPAELTTENWIDSWDSGNLNSHNDH